MLESVLGNHTGKLYSSKPSLEHHPLPREISQDFFQFLSVSVPGPTSETLENSQVPIDAPRTATVSSTPL